MNFSGRRDDLLGQRAISEFLDTDKVALHALKIIDESIRRWKEGMLCTEEPLISSLVANLRLPNRVCAAAHQQPAYGWPMIAVTHRRGPRSTDLYGTDIAITLLVGDGSDYAMKTALFQLKITNGNGGVTIERSQLEDSLKPIHVRPRAFIAAADHTTETLRIATAGRILRNFHPEASTKKSYPLRDRGWFTLAQWLEKWLQCHVGPRSNILSPGVENALIARFEGADSTVQKIAAEIETARGQILAKKEERVLNYEMPGMLDVDRMERDLSFGNTAAWFFQRIDALPLNRPE